MLGRIFSNTVKQISRSGWSGWASISVMTLAFLVASVFGGLAYISNLYIQFIESKSNLLVFFNEGMDKDIITTLQNKWTQNPKIKSIHYTSEDDAYNMFSDYTAVVQKELYAVLKTKETKTLPSSLDIQLSALSDLQSVKDSIQTDIDAANKNLIIVNTSDTSANPASYPTSYANPDLVTYKYSSKPGVAPITLKVDDASLEQLRQVLYFLRVVGLVVLSILFVGIFFFTFMTVEFRLQNQTDEIGVMQLVGGSLFFIRSPYILEGGFYGLIGALISSLLISVFMVVVFVINKDSTVSIYLYKLFSKLPWPQITTLGWVGVVGVLAFIGFLIGSMSSYVSIRRYIR